ncbi:DUF6270 domain-containing protein [Brachybacterium sp. FME24]|uniref:DUF6270 domain-containing protein n=1 Tax=Brachybacterium sp. FME24 TaxID=2742605 RepID=UPI0018674CF7|nr:DUF6270 domain-containing protein [Brachybacterium sp. FME24]
MTDQPATTTPARVTIYGSCVARDSVDLAGGSQLTVADYIARQSLISAGQDAAARFPADPQVSSRFQRRMMEADFSGDLETRLDAIAARTDLLLWDLTDERHGVHVFDDGTVVTRSIDLTAVPEVLAVVDEAHHVAFGTDEHFALWSPRAEQFRDHLRQLDLVDKTVVLQVPWALVTTDGRETPVSMGTSAIEANEAYRRYYERLRELGFTLLEMQPLGVLADPEHRWGLAPFHYTQDVYEEIIQRVLAELRSEEA